ncbi:MAG: MBL fold metallo-hydrolase [Gemmatimonadetes bacterium]|nr:MBL fold metallo-hydrolase [Gemmatimonadota bacterium]
MPPSPPYAVILGTAQDGGYPHVGCACDACEAAAADPERARRVACLGLVTSKGMALIDATPDFASQARDLARLARRPASSPLRAVLLTHLHAGHILGLPLLGREGWATDTTPVWATESCLGFLENNEPYARLFRDGHASPRVLHLGWDTSLDDLVIQPIPVPHRSEAGDTVAYRIEGPGRSLFYAPDLDALVPDVLDHLRAADIALLDGTFFRRHELRRDDANTVPHPAIADTMAKVSAIDTKIIFTHLNHTNPALDPESRERRAVEALGMRIAAEGQILELD